MNRSSIWTTWLSKSKLGLKSWNQSCPKITSKFASSSITARLRVKLFLRSVSLTEAIVLNLNVRDLTWRLKFQPVFALPNSLGGLLLGRSGCNFQHKANLSATEASVPAWVIIIHQSTLSSLLPSALIARLSLLVCAFRTRFASASSLRLSVGHSHRPHRSRRVDQRPPQRLVPLLR